MRIVLKIGGSILFGDGFDLELIKKYSHVIRNLVENKNELFIVVGGGKLAREYIRYARSLGASEEYCDVVGIKCAQINAMLVISSISDIAYPFPVINFEEALRLLSLKKVLVLGGTQPGQSTNAVAALLSETVEADLFINLTDVDGVYTENPKNNPSAKLLRNVKADQLEEILKGESVKAGSYPLFDPLAIKIIKRSKIKTIIAKGSDPNVIAKAVLGEDIGTEIKT